MRRTLCVVLVPLALASVAACGDQRGAEGSRPPGSTLAAPSSAAAVPASSGSSPRGCDPGAELARPTGVPDEAWAPPTRSAATRGQLPLTEDEAVTLAKARGGYGGADVEVDAQLGPLGAVPLTPAPQGPQERCVYVVTVAAPLRGAPSTGPGLDGGYVVVADYATGEVLAVQPR